MGVVIMGSEVKISVIIFEAGSHDFGVLLGLSRHIVR
jgi:hypothetical protein